MSNPESGPREPETIELQEADSETPQEEELSPSPVFHFEHRLNTATTVLNELNKELSSAEAEKDEDKIQELQGKIKKEADNIARYQDIINSLESGETDKAEEELERELKLVGKKYSEYYSDILGKLRKEAKQPDPDVLAPAEQPAPSAGETIVTDNTVVAPKTEQPAPVPVPAVEAQPAPVPAEAPAEAENTADAVEDEHQKKLKKMEAEFDRAVQEKPKFSRDEFIKARLSRREANIMGDPLAEVWDKLSPEERAEFTKKEHGDVKDVGSFKKAVQDNFRDGARSIYEKYGDTAINAFLNAGYNPYGARRVGLINLRVEVPTMDGVMRKKTEQEVEEMITQYWDKIRIQAEHELEGEYNRRRQDIIEKKVAEWEEQLKNPPKQEEKKGLPPLPKSELAEPAEEDVPFFPEKYITKKGKFKKGALPDNIKKHIIAEIEQNILLYPAESEAPNKKELEDREQGLIVAFKRKKFREEDTDLIRETFDYFLTKTANAKEWAVGKNKTSKEYKKWKKLSEIARELADQVFGRDIREAAIEKFDDLTPEQIEDFKKDPNYKNEKDFRNRYIKTFEDNVIKNLQSAIAFQEAAAAMGATFDSGGTSRPPESENPSLPPADSAEPVGANEPSVQKGEAPAEDQFDAERLTDEEVDKLLGEDLTEDEVREILGEDLTKEEVDELRERLGESPESPKQSSFSDTESERPLSRDDKFLSPPSEDLEDINLGENESEEARPSLPKSGEGEAPAKPNRPPLPSAELNSPSGNEAEKEAAAELKRIYGERQILLVKEKKIRQDISDGKRESDKDEANAELREIKQEEEKLFNEAVHFAPPEVMQKTEALGTPFPGDLDTFIQKNYDKFLSYKTDTIQNQLNSVKDRLIADGRDPIDLVRDIASCAKNINKLTGKNITGDDGVLCLLADKVYWKGEQEGAVSIDDLKKIKRTGWFKKTLIIGKKEISPNELINKILVYSGGLNEYADTTMRSYFKSHNWVWAKETFSENFWNTLGGM